MGKARIISYSQEPFSGRLEAARLLGQELEKFRGKNVVVLGIPRGGIIIAEEIVSMLVARLDVVLTHKLGAPGNPELAIGAVTEEGRIFLNKALAERLGAESGYLQAEKERQLNIIKQRVEQYRRILPKVSLKGASVIITDDGVATGATMKAALWVARQEHPEKLIAALPVGPEETIQELAIDADEVICLRAPYFFSAIGQFYLDFSQVEDSEALEILRQEAKRKVENENR
jgi:predicted phosphoribosyltransferase